MLIAENEAIVDGTLCPRSGSDGLSLHAACSTVNRYMTGAR